MLHVKLPQDWTSREWENTEGWRGRHTWMLLPTTELHAFPEWIRWLDACAPWVVHATSTSRFQPQDAEQSHRGHHPIYQTSPHATPSASDTNSSPHFPIAAHDEGSCSYHEQGEARVPPTPSTFSSHGLSDTSHAGLTPPELTAESTGTSELNSGYQLTTDKSDYAPGSLATFTLTGAEPGATVTFEVVDLPSEPGLNGIADVYAPFTVTDGADGDLDGAVNGTIIANWSVPSDGSATLATLQVTASSDGQTATATFTDSNRIILENQKAGTPQSYWNVARSNQIEGFTTDFSINSGQSVDFKINVNGTQSQTLPYKLEIFRLGYYGGDGATLVATINNADGTVQPNPLYDASLGMVDAGNWSVTDSWSVPADAVSGVYIARLQRLDTNGNPISGATNQIPFIVRNDNVGSDIVLQTSDTTWQAYNAWWGNNGQIGANFYGDASGTINHPDVADPGLGAQDRAYALSYNRPFVTDIGGPASGPWDYLYGADYAAIYWLEQNGYDVSYMSGIDADRLGTSWFQDAQGNLLTKAYISVGHDEYWSGAQRANVEAARDAGVNLLFWSGNEVYWKTRYQSSIDASATDYRTLVSYKETWANGDPNAPPQDYANIDPSNEWTGTWRDLRFVNSVDANGVPIATGATPENSLTGQLFLGDGTREFGAALDVPAEYTDLRYWRGTAVENSNGTFDIAPGLIGYEWNTSPVDEYRPAGLIKLSETLINWGALLTDQGNRSEPGTGMHALTLYRADSGALVFGSGTVFWSWGLSNEHAQAPYFANIENLALQQFTVNLFADMGIQPGSLKTGLTPATASSDQTPALITMQDIPALVTALEPVTISGTATDDDGNPLTADGAVALVEISLDGGITWRPAQGTTNWTYQWTPTQTGTFEIKARAIDDSLNSPSALQIVSDTVNVDPPTSFSLFGTFATVPGVVLDDNRSIELGTKFQASEAGTITALKYYRSAIDATDTDVREGALWTSSGTLLATVTFTSLPGASGWQVAQLAAPVSIAPDTTYVVSYHTDDYYFSQTRFFDTAYTEPFGYLSSPASPFPDGDGVNGNGLYTYSTNQTFPTLTWRNENYWVDVSFAPASLNSLTDSDASANAVLENAALGTLVGITALDPAGIGSVTYSLYNDAGGRFAIDAATGVVSVAGPIDRESTAG